MVDEAEAAQRAARTIPARGDVRDADHRLARGPALGAAAAPPQRARSVSRCAAPEYSRRVNYSQRLAATTPTSSDLGLLLVRLAFGGTLALVHGWPKMFDVSQFAEGVARLGFPAPSLFAFAAAAGELLGGLCLALGLFTRPASLLVLVTMLVAALHVHGADPFAKKELALAYAAISLALLVAGAGRFSLDRVLFNRGAT